MPTTTNVEQVKINVMNKAQYASATKNPNELYAVTDADVLPDQTGNSGKFLTTDGTDASWATVDALPDQTGHAGEFLSTDGTDASWQAINASGYHPDLFDWKWADHICNDVQWLRADTFSWQSGSVYQAAFNELFYDIYTHTTWYVSDQPLVRTYSPAPAVGDPVYYEPYPTTQVGTVTAYDDVNNTITVSNGYTYAYNSNQYVTPTTETVAGITVTYYPGTSGRKIVPMAYMSAVESVYAATGVAWYYIIEIPSKRFKLPRWRNQEVVQYVQNLDGSWYRLYADGWVEQGGIIANNSTSTTVTLPVEMLNTNYTLTGGLMSGTASTSYEHMNFKNITTTTFDFETYDNYGVRWYVCGMSAADLSEYQAGEKHLYFYVGEFTQTALENTAGINASTFNGKADTDLANTPMATADYVTEWQTPTALNDYTWYRKYKSGWVEQGGVYDSSFTGTKTFNLPIEMADTNYTLTTGTGCSNVGGMHGKDYITSKATTSFDFTTASIAGNFAVSLFNWRVEGMAA